MENIFNELISLKDGASLVNKEESTIRRHILNGKFNIGEDCKKFGKQWIFKKDVLKKFYNDYNEEDFVMTSDACINNILQITSLQEKADSVETLFTLIDRSLISNRGNSKKQDEKFRELLSKEDIQDIKDMSLCFSVLKEKISEVIVNENFCKPLHDIGIYTDDSFDDFACWIIGQGKEVVNKVFVYGINYILKYIAINKITIENYRYECLIAYSFHNYLD